MIGNQGQTLKKQFHKGEISLENQEEITKLSETFYVKRTSIEHLTNLQLTKNIHANTREEEQRQRKEKEYNAYDWLNLVLEGKLNTLKVCELDKYIDENKLCKKGKKKDKLSAIN
ncbi:Transient receptor potential cation channel subfamily A member 1 [Paramuricea clavata]|uniref:Transient receptor potential cation channel subfamily A member 1 n=1 Tax=Paramuricea clavata TaxID=317549 RepID=A0A7D9JJR6_PARCT|nr:Transient receptor potential cation channel subfamily A member 1 [Paramuricea clavata]